MTLSRLNKVELVLSIICFVSIILTYFNIANASMVVFFSGLALSLLYFPFGFLIFQKAKNLNKEQGKIVFSLLFGFALSVILVSLIIYQKQFYDEYELYTLSSTLGLASIIYCAYKRGKDTAYYNTMFLRMLFWLIALGIVFEY